MTCATCKFWNNAPFVARDMVGACQAITHENRYAIALTTSEGYETSGLLTKATFGCNLHQREKENGLPGCGLDAVQNTVVASSQAPREPFECSF